MPLNNRMRYYKSVYPIVFGLSAVLLSGCASMAAALSYERVKPWERGALASAAMQPVLDSMDQSVDDHIYFSREASKGGNGARGGGCGCN